MAIDLMAIAWQDFLLFAVNDDNIVTAFERSTGVKLVSAPTSGIEAMIDRATGAPEHRMMSFILWATKHFWGTEGVPQEILDRLDEAPDIPSVQLDGAPTAP
jgi:hypothetical protein